MACAWISDGRLNPISVYLGVIPHTGNYKAFTKRGSRPMDSKEVAANKRFSAVTNRRVSSPTNLDSSSNVFAALPFSSTWLFGSAGTNSDAVGFI